MNQRPNTDNSPAVSSVDRRPCPAGTEPLCVFHTDGTPTTQGTLGVVGAGDVLDRLPYLHPPFHPIIIPPSLSAQITRNRTASDVGNLLAITIFPRVFHEDDDERKSGLHQVMGPPVAVSSKALQLFPLFPSLFSAKLNGNCRNPDVIQNFF